jgi:mono/diheme cytochrome c family protein
MVLRFLGFICVAGLISSCGSDNNTGPMTGDQSPMNQQVDGRTSYVVNCSSCHGVDGRLGASQAADLSKSVLNDAEIMKMINEGNDKGMMPYKEILSLEEREAIVDFVKKLKRKSD